MAKYRKTTIKKRSGNKKTQRRGGGFLRSFWGGDIEEGVTEPVTADVKKTKEGATGWMNNTFGSVKNMFSSNKEDEENKNPNTTSMMEEGKAKDIPASMVGGKKKKCGCSGSPSLIGGRRRKSRKGRKLIGAFNPNSDLVTGMRLKKKSEGLMTTKVYRFYKYDDTKGVSPNGSRYGTIYNESGPLQHEVVEVNDLKKLWSAGGKRKTKKTKKSRKTKKTKKSRKTRRR